MGGFFRENGVDRSVIVMSRNLEKCYASKTLLMRIRETVLGVETGLLSPHPPPWNGA